MREALAAAGHDFTLSGPVPKLKKDLRSRIRATRKSEFGRRFRQVRRYLPLLAAFLFVALAIAILINALLGQKTRHPAPLFSRAIPAAAARKPSSPEMLPGPVHRRPPSAPAPLEAGGQEGQGPPLVQPGLGMPETSSLGQTSRRVSPSRPGDPISQLLQAAQNSRAQPAQNAKSKIADKSVMAAQRALVQLGFVLKPDGIAGAETRQAIARYERERGLPVHGDLTPELMRKLTAETGIPAD